MLAESQISITGAEQHGHCSAFEVVMYVAHYTQAPHA